MRAYKIVDAGAEDFVAAGGADVAPLPLPPPPPPPVTTYQLKAPSVDAYPTREWFRLGNRAAVGSWKGFHEPMLGLLPMPQHLLCSSIAQLRPLSQPPSLSKPTWSCPTSMPPTVRIMPQPDRGMRRESSASFFTDIESLISFVSSSLQPPTSNLQPPTSYLLPLTSSTSRGPVPGLRRCRRRSFQAGGKLFWGLLRFRGLFLRCHWKVNGCR